MRDGMSPASDATSSPGVRNRRLPVAPNDSSPVPEEDAQLMRRVGKGEVAALADLYEKYFDIVRDYLASRDGHRQSCEDLAQEVFLQAWRAAARFQGGSTIKTYLIGIARYVHLQAVERRVRESGLREAPQRAESVCPYCEGPCPLTGFEAVLCQTEQMKSLVRAIGRLPDLSRQAAESTIVRRLSVGEAAEAAGCTRKVFLERLRRAVSELRGTVRRRPRRPGH